MAMTSTRACNMNSLPTNRMRSLLAIWLEMASGSRNWDGFLIGNGWLTGKTWEKMICSQCLPLKVIPSTHLPYWVARLESHQRRWQSRGRPENSGGRWNVKMHDFVAGSFQIRHFLSTQPTFQTSSSGRKSGKHRPRWWFDLSWGPGGKFLRFMLVY